MSLSPPRFQRARTDTGAPDDIRVSPAYFLTGAHVHFSAGLAQPEQTLFLISRPHFLHGVQPHV